MAQNKKTTKNKQDNKEQKKTFSFADLKCDRVVQLAHKESNEYRKGDILLLRRCNKYPQGELIAVEAEKGDGASICRLYIDEDVRYAMMTFEDHSMPYLFPLEDLKDIHIFGQVIGVYHPIVK